MAEVCAGLEVRARRAQVDDAAALMEQFEAEFARVQAALQERGRELTCAS